MMQLAHDATQSDVSQVEEDVDKPSVSVGYRIATRGAILTDLRRMLDEVQDVVMMTSDASMGEVGVLNGQQKDKM